MEIRRLTENDVLLLMSLSSVFGDVFDQRPTYCDLSPSEAYIRSLLSSSTFISLAAIEDDVVVGGLACYELRKFEQERSEFYIYDLAVLKDFRRRGIATELIELLKVIARGHGAYEIFVQADTAPEDEPAIALYKKFGVREEVLHFSIPIESA